MPVIQVKNLGKAYKQYSSHWAKLAEWTLPLRKPRHQQNWVIRNVNFSVKEGDAVGIVGINGTGKSTLLKMIAGTTRATEGSVEIRGQVAALLELGMGFHQDFTGRQNVIMAGQLLGFSKEELITLMPEIEAFAEIGEYIDHPVRVYSSGMQMRLAFSVATAKRPDVLIVDEALSVGDTYFQHKSFNRIREFREQGSTLLLVSHDKGAIQSICDRAILLDSGGVAMEGRPEEVMDYYNAMIAERENATVMQQETEDGRLQTISGTAEANVIENNIVNEKGEVIEIVNVGEEVTLSIKVRINQQLPKLVLGYLIKDKLGQAIYGTNTYKTGSLLEDVKAGEIIEYRFKFAANLGPGVYSIATALTDGDTHLDNNFEWRDLALIFTVVNINRTEFTGCVWLQPNITLQRQNEYEAS